MIAAQTARPAQRFHYFNVLYDLLAIIHFDESFLGFLN
jgi:hypothetical protein